MDQDSYLGMRPGDLDDKPYAKYWNPVMKGLSSEVRDGLSQSPLPSCQGFSDSQCHRLMDPGYLPMESGFARLSSGELFVAVRTPMPGVTGDMIDWWFGWHSDENQRYKLWHPNAHMKAVMEQPTADSPELGDRDRYLDNVSYVDEYVGSSIQKLAIQFKSPVEFFLDESGFDAAGVQTAICANVGLAGLPLNFGKLVHLVRSTGDGCEMRSRFWLGKLSLRDRQQSSFINRIIGNRLISKLAVGRRLGHDLLVHCAMEMTHLASFLPELYSDYH
jgi:hypothetical protein